MILVFPCDMCPAHDPGPIGSLEHLYFAHAAAALPATDGNPALNAKLRGAEHRLLLGT